jgi:hypothetical protein
MECFLGWRKGEPGEARGGGGPVGEGQHEGGTGEEGPGGGELDGCIMHRVHTSHDKFQKKQCEAEVGPAFFLSLLIDFHVVINQALDATLCCFQNLTIHLHLILHPPIQ